MIHRSPDSNDRELAKRLPKEEIKKAIIVDQKPAGLTSEEFRRLYLEGLNPYAAKTTHGLDFKGRI